MGKALPGLYSRLQAKNARVDAVKRGPTGCSTLGAAAVDWCATCQDMQLWDMYVGQPTATYHAMVTKTTQLSTGAHASLGRTAEGSDCKFSAVLFQYNCTNAARCADTATHPSGGWQPFRFEQSSAPTSCFACRHTSIDCSSLFIIAGLPLPVPALCLCL